jgi:hypothetical protein
LFDGVDPYMSGANTTGKGLRQRRLPDFLCNVGSPRDGPNRVPYAQRSFGQDLRPESAAVK